MVKALPLVILFALLIFGPWYFLKSPFDAAYCLMSGDEWAKQGQNGRYCKEIFADADKNCSTGGQCKSGKCVIGVAGRMRGINAVTMQKVAHEDIALGVFNNVIDDKILGTCAYTNQEPCYSGEMLLDNNRIVSTPTMCD